MTPQRLGKAARYSLETMGNLFEGPLNDSGIVVAETQVVIQGRETVGLTRLLHFVQLWNFKLMVLNCAPVMRGRVHGKQGASVPSTRMMIWGSSSPNFSVG
jgi:hypothetical protein